MDVKNMALSSFMHLIEQDEISGITYGHGLTTEQLFKVGGAISLLQLVLDKGFIGYMVYLQIVNNLTVRDILQ